MEIDARISRHDNRTQTLEEHAKAVAAICSETLKSVGLSQTGYLCGLLHDLGKASPVFQAYLHEEDEGKRRQQKGKINHSSAGAQYIDMILGKTAQKREHVLLSDILKLCICGHHSGMPDSLSIEGEDILSKRVYPEKEILFDLCVENFLLYSIDKELLQRTQQNAILEITKLLSDMQQVNENVRNNYLGLMIRLVFSALIDADRYDAYLFEQNKPLSKAGLDEKRWEVFSERLEQRLSCFDTNTPLSKKRTQIADDCLAAADWESGIYRLLAPTGGGKTLASLRFALNHAKKYNKKRIFYIIPFTTILDQTEKEIKKTLQDEESILLHHSNVIKEEIAEEELQKRELLTERWNESPIILTTMVQFLNSMFAGRNSSIRRMQALQDSVLIFDEVQSVPTKCIHLFNIACEFLRDFCGATILHCTATQPALEKTVFPISYGRDILDNVDELFASFKRTELKDMRKNAPMTVDEIASFANELVPEYHSVLIILNTKKSAKNVYNVLKQMEMCSTIVHLSTSMCAAHRLQEIEKIQKLLANKTPLICVSTQLIEAGVDLSFGTVIRSLAGIPNIAQAAGRCNRHGEDKMLHPVYIIEQQGENLDKLPEILEGQGACRQTIADFSGKETELLSPKVVSHYYQTIYRKNATKERMNYPIEEDGVYAVLRDLLGNNSQGKAAYRAAPEKRMTTNRFVVQAFGTAGKHFKAIESETTSVIVSFGDGEKLIADLLDAQSSIEKIIATLKRCQQFSVSLFPYEIAKLQEKNALIQTEFGAIILQKEYYNKQSGVQLERGELELCHY